MFQPHHALISACLVSWALLLVGSWLEYYLLEHCGLSKLKQVCMTNDWIKIWVDICLDLKVSLCLFQGTQLDWTLAQLQQISLVRCLSFLFIDFFYFLFIWFLLSPLSSFFRMSLLRRKTTTCLYQPSPLREQQRQRKHWKHPKHTDQQHGMRLW